MIWVLAIIFAAPAAIISDAVPHILNNITNATIVVCSPFGQQKEYTATYTK